MDLGDNASTDCELSLTDGETESLVDSGGVDQLNGHFDVVSWHTHLSTLQLNFASNIGGTDEKLGSIINN